MFHTKHYIIIFIFLLLLVLVVVVARKKSLPEKLCRYNDNEKISHKKGRNIETLRNKKREQKIKAHLTLIERNILEAKRGLILHDEREIET